MASEKLIKAAKENGKKGGRPIASATLITQKMRELMAQRVEARFGPIIDAQIDAAIGIVSEKFDRKTGELYYVEEGPSTNAAKFITEQVLGRPKETVEHSGEVKGLVGLITSLNNGDNSE